MIHPACQTQKRARWQRCLHQAQAKRTAGQQLGRGTSILLVPPIGYLQRSPCGRLASRLAKRQLPAANALTACSSCFSAAMAAQPLRRRRSWASAFPQPAEICPRIIDKNQPIRSTQSTVRTYSVDASGLRDTRGAGAYEKEQKSEARERGSEAAISGSAAEPSTAGVRA